MGSGQSSTEVGGFRVFKINDGSPASEAGLEVFFDFIVEINETKMSGANTHFFNKIQESENKRTKLVLHNIRTHMSRDVFVTPRKWSGAGLLGAVVRYDVLDSDSQQGIRVLEVLPNSPAAEAGLMAYKDYLLGTTEVMFSDMDELVELVNVCLGKKVQIYVYNSDTESIREVTIVPRIGWGGEGAIGADIRTGILHRIPAPRRNFNHLSQAVPVPSVAAMPTPSVASSAPFTGVVSHPTQFLVPTTLTAVAAATAVAGHGPQPYLQTLLPQASPEMAQAMPAFSNAASTVPTDVQPSWQWTGAAAPGVVPMQPSAAVAWGAAPLVEESSVAVQLENARRTLAAMEAAVASAALPSGQMQLTADPSLHRAVAEASQLYTADACSAHVSISAAAGMPLAPAAAMAPSPVHVGLAMASATAPMGALLLDEVLVPGVIYEIPGSS